MTNKTPYLITTDGFAKSGNDRVFCIGVSMRTGEQIPYLEVTRALGRGNPSGKECYASRANAEKACKIANAAKEGEKS